MTGRPPTGVRPGERLTDYKRVTVRLPPETVAQLEDLSEKLARPQWRVMCDAIAALSQVGLMVDGRPMDVRPSRG